MCGGRGNGSDPRSLPHADASETMAAVLIPLIREFRSDDFDRRALAARKGDQTVSVCIPARNEVATIGSIVATVIEELVRDVPLVDEVLVIDDHSTDGTAAVARAAGATVVAAADVLPTHGSGHGKGEALWKSLFVSTGDLVVWCDGDLVDFDPAFVIGIVGPLIERPEIGFVKGFYDRPLNEQGEGGGRVTELVARPLLSFLFPALSTVEQPLGGEYGGRREILEQLPFVTGYGVDIGLLIDVSRRFGIDALAQVDLGERRHRNRPIDELAPQAAMVMQAALRRADLDADRAGQPLVGEHVTLVRRDGAVEIDGVERPPLITLAEYRERHDREPVEGSSELHA